MRTRVVVFACACALSIGACLYPEYSVKQDGGTAGAAGPGTGGRGGANGGTAGTGGAVAGAGRGGSANATAGTSGGGGSSGAAGSVSGLAGGGSAGRGGTTGTAGTGGGSAGRGGTTGAAGTGGGSAGRGGTTGVGGGPVGAGGNAGRGGSISLPGTAGSSGGLGGGPGGGAAGRGGTTGAGGSAGGSTVAPTWLPSIAVVYQFDLPQGQIGSEAHGDPAALHLEEDTNDSLLPTSDAVNFIEGKSGKLPGPVSAPAYFRSPSGAALPSVFRTEPGTSFTTGGWFRIDSTLSNELQYLISDEGPAGYQGGFIFYLDQRLGSFSTSAALAYCRIGTSETNFNYKEVQTVTEVGPDPVAGNRWVHLVCRFDASSNQLSIFVAGIRTANVTDTTHPIKTGPGPFMLGCDTSFCAFIGNMDEVFYATTALPDEDIIRIYGCGIDGSRCRCSGSNYFNCGFVPASSCGSLPACNAPTP